jgi:hypothetical protein
MCPFIWEAMRSFRKWKQAQRRKALGWLVERSIGKEIKLERCKIGGFAASFQSIEHNIEYGVSLWDIIMIMIIIINGRDWCESAFRWIENQEIEEWKDVIFKVKTRIEKV